MICPICRGHRWVCENHPDKPWAPDGCECGAGMPCVCNERVEVPLDKITVARPIGKIVGPESANEADHFRQCEQCGAMYDMRDFEAMIAHEGPLPHRKDN